MASRTKSEADQKLDQAEDLLKKLQRSMSNLDYAFAQNQITQTRGLVCIAFWQRNRSDVHLRDQGQRWLLTALEKYDWLAKRCEDDAEAMEQRLNESQLDRSESYKTTVGNISRANYKKAWTQYLLGLSADTPEQRQVRLKSALDGFIGFTARGYRNDPIVADCFVGQARCLYELGRHFEVTKVLDTDEITQNNTTPDIFKRVTGLRIKAYEALSRHLMVDNCAGMYFDSLPDDHSLDAAELDMAVSWARSLALVVSDPALERYKAMCEERIAKIRKLIWPHGQLWRTRLAQILADSEVQSPFGYLERARQYFAEKQYEQAVGQTDMGLAVSKGAGDEQMCAELRYIRFAAYWNWNRWLEAHRAAVDFLKNHRQHHRADDVCNMSIESGLNALKSEPALETAQFLKHLEYAEQNFPQASQVKKAPWYRAHLLLQDGRYAAAIEILTAIKPDLPVYRQAQLDLARGLFKQAEAARETKKVDAKELARLYLDAAAALGRFADESLKNSARSESSGARSAVEIAVATAGRLLGLDPLEPNTVLELLDRIQPLKDDVTRDRLLAARAEANILAGNTDIADKMIDELLDAESSDSEMVVALINIANRREHIRAGIGQRQEDVRSIDQRLVRIYIRLLDSIKKNKAIADREPAVRLYLAKRLLGLGRYTEAIGHYKWYLGNVPVEKAYDAIRDLALAYEQLGGYESALDQWRKLYSRTERRTNEWIEAAYHIIRCHVKAGNFDQASRVLSHFRALCPKSQLGEWGPRFETVEKELLQTKAGTGP
jgi:hypothetical protein